MKKQTKLIIMMLFMVLVLGFSTIAFVVMSKIPETEQPETIGKPTKLIYDEQLNESYRTAYIRMGYTLVEFHKYQGCCQQLETYIDVMPEELNVIVQKITDNSIKQPWIKIESIVGEEQTNSTDIKEIFNTACKVLPKPPIDCGLSQFNTTSNITAKNLTQ